MLVTPDGRAKVLDFGFAKSVDVNADLAATAKETNLNLGGNARRDPVLHESGAGPG